MIIYEVLSRLSCAVWNCSSAPRTYHSRLLKQVSSRTNLTQMKEICKTVDFQFLVSFRLHSTPTRCVTLRVANPTFVVYSALQTRSWGAKLLIIMRKAPGQCQVREYCINRAILDSICPTGGRYYAIIRRGSPRITRRHQSSRNHISRNRREQQIQTNRTSKRQASSTIYQF